MTNLRLPGFAAAVAGAAAAGADAGLPAGGASAGSTGCRLLSSTTCVRSGSPRPVAASPSAVSGSGRMTRAAWSLAAAITGLPTNNVAVHHALSGTGPHLWQNYH